MDLEEGSSGGDPKQIQKKYKQGISFSSYSMDDEPEDDEGPSEAPPPTDKLLDASPSYLTFRRTVASNQRVLEDRCVRSRQQRDLRRAWLVAHDVMDDIRNSIGVRLVCPLIKKAPS